MTTAEPISPPVEVVAQIMSFISYKQKLYAGKFDDGETTLLLKIESTDAQPSNVRGSFGQKEPPFDMAGAINLMHANIHHSRCIDAKVAAMIGLGFMTEEDHQARKDAATLQAQQANPAPGDVGGKKPPPQSKPGAPPAGLAKELPGGKPPISGSTTTAADKQTPTADNSPQETAGAQTNPGTLSRVEEILDPLCDVSFQDVQTRLGENYWQIGNCYLEVVRGAGEKITGLHFIPGHTVNIYIEDELNNRHYIVKGESGDVKMAVFGDKADFIRRLAPEDPNKVSEVIHFQRPSSRSRWYGIPDWLAATVGIELSRCLHRHFYDYFNNRGVPEFLLFILGKKLPPADWKALTDSLKAQIGLGNAHKSIAVNISDPEVKIQLEKLAMEGASNNNFPEMNDALNIEIVNGHGVPPVLAGITLPGKMGATNETASALELFQKLMIGPAQKIFTTILNKTLGDPTKNGGLGLKRGDFIYKSILDPMPHQQQANLAQMDTVARMKTELPTAKAQGRNPADGLKKEDTQAA